MNWLWTTLLCMIVAFTMMPAFANASDSDVEINETNFPDDNFRSYVSEKLDITGDGIISDIEITLATTIDCNNKEITSLKGIEYFTEVKSLNCGKNNLTVLDVSQNTALTKLNCYSNNLMSLDVSKNVNLQELGCYANNLTSLNVGNNTSLTTLYCYSNQLTELDVSNNTLLTKLGVFSNELTSLDLSNNTALQSVQCQNNKLTELDVSNNTALTKLECGSNEITNLDLSENTELKTLSCRSGKLVSLDVSNNVLLTELYCDQNNLTSLDVSNNTALKMMYCYSNNLTSLDVSNNVELTLLYCNQNSLSELDVSKNTALVSLDCSLNNITNLDVSKNVALERLMCQKNLLTELDVSKNTALTRLYCMYMDLTELDVSHNTELEYLACYDSNLTSLDVSHNTSLTELYCFDNSLTSLDLSKNTALQYLKCYSNNLTSLDVSNCTALQLLDGHQNKYRITTRKFDLSTLPGGFDVTKASNWDGASVNGNILTVDSGVIWVSYSYDVGFGNPVTFLLEVDCEEHIHCLDGGTVTKATTSKNGKITYTCSDCGEKTSTVIYYPKTITLSATSYIYNGKMKKPKVTVKGANGKTISSSNYTVSYASGRKNVGKYKVTIKFKGNYSGTVTKDFTIKPKGTSISSFVKASKAFTVKWKKQSTKMATTRITGYQIQYSTSKTFSSNVKSKTVSGYSNTSKKISGLKAKTTYYVRIRTYKTVNGTKYYSGWSTTRTVKTK